MSQVEPETIPTPIEDELSDARSAFHRRMALLEAENAELKQVQRRLEGVLSDIEHMFKLVNAQLQRYRNESKVEKYRKPDLDNAPGVIA
jgi:hypothetical protein